VRLEALLADALGYPRAAREAGSALPADDPVRAYVTRADVELAAMASGGHDRLTRFLRLRRLARMHALRFETAWRGRAFQGEAFTVPVLGARLEEPDIQTERAVSFAMPTLVALAAAERVGDTRARATADELAKWTDLDSRETVANPEVVFSRAVKKVQGDLGFTDATLLDTFEASVAQIGSGVSGVIFDAQLEKTYFGAAMGTALYRAGIHALDRWNALGAAKGLLASYAKGGGGLGDDWRAWYGALVKAQDRSERAGGALWASVGILPNLGAPATLRVVEELEKSADWGDPRILGAARQVFARVDSRARHRGALMTVAYSGLLDLGMVERFGLSLADLEPSSALAWALDFLGDTRALEKLLHDPDVEPYVAGWIVPRLQASGALDDEAARAELKKLVAAAPDVWPLRSTFADYLEARGAFADERALAEGWLVRNAKNGGLTPIVAKTLIARTYYLENNYAAGGVLARLQGAKRAPLHRSERLVPNRRGVDAHPGLRVPASVRPAAGLAIEGRGALAPVITRAERTSRSRRGGRARSSSPRP
jgi:hypothetical protein